MASKHHVAAGPGGQIADERGLDVDAISHVIAILPLQLESPPLGGVRPTRSRTGFSKPNVTRPCTSLAAGSGQRVLRWHSRPPTDHTLCEMASFAKASADFQGGVGIRTGLLSRVGTVLVADGPSKPRTTT